MCGLGHHLKAHISAECFHIEIHCTIRGFPGTHEFGYTANLGNVPDVFQEEFCVLMPPGNEEAMTSVHKGRMKPVCSQADNAVDC